MIDVVGQPRLVLVTHALASLYVVEVVVLRAMVGRPAASIMHTPSSPVSAVVVCCHGLGVERVNALYRISTARGAWARVRLGPWNMLENKSCCGMEAVLVCVIDS